MRFYILLLVASALLLAGCVGQKAGPPATTALPEVTTGAPAPTAVVPIEAEIADLMPTVNVTEPDLPVPDFGVEEGVDLGSVL